MRSKGLVFPNETVYPDILLFPIKFKCKVPETTSSFPRFVSVVNSVKENPSNLLKVVYNIPQQKRTKKTVMICTKVNTASRLSLLDKLNIKE